MDSYGFVQSILATFPPKNQGWNISGRNLRRTGSLSDWRVGLILAEAMVQNRRETVARFTWNIPILAELGGWFF